MIITPIVDSHRLKLWQITQMNDISNYTAQNNQLIMFIIIKLK